MKLAHRRRPKPHIDMTPLIDCVFTIMIMILMVATFQQLHSIQMNLPQAGVQDDLKTPEILISINAQDQFFLDAKPIDREQLESLLKERLANSKRRIVTFQGDIHISYQSFVRVLDVARAAGAIHIDVIHDLISK